RRRHQCLQIFSTWTHVFSCAAPPPIGSTRPPPPSTESSSRRMFTGNPRLREGAYPVSSCPGDRKSTRLNSSHVSISYAVYYLIKKNRLSLYEVSKKSVMKMKIRIMKQWKICII